MIFVTVGTQLPFDRLVRSVDLWAGAHPDVQVHAQIGAVPADGYHPQHMKSTPTLPPAEFDRLCREARLIVAHAGTGSLIKAQTLGTPVLAMPRRGTLGEHRNDHQIATAAHFAGRGGIHIVNEEAEMGTAIDRLLSDNAPPPVLSLYAEDRLLDAMRTVIFSGSDR